MCYTYVYIRMYIHIKKTDVSGSYFAKKLMSHLYSILVSRFFGSQNLF